jgi:nucleoside-diphosphate-sugar epimerase
VINGDGSQTRDFTFVDDVVAILIKSLSISIDQPRVNLAFGRPISLNEIVEKLATYFPDIQVKYEKKRQGDIEKSENNPSLLKQYFGDFPVTSFDEALSSTIEWYRKNAHLIEQYPNITE